MKSNKKIILTLVLVVLAVFFISRNSQGSLTLEPYDKEDLDERVELVLTDKSVAYKFSATKELKSLKIQTQKIEGESFVERSPGINFDVNNTSGNLVLDWDDGINDYVVSLIHENVNYTKENNFQFLPLDPADKEDLKAYTYYLDRPEKIFYGRKLPMAIRSYGDKLTDQELDFFYENGYFEKDYDNLYAVTVMFSKEALDPDSYLNWLDKSEISYGDKTYRLVKEGSDIMDYGYEEVGEISEVYTDGGDLPHKEGVFISDGTEEVGDKVFMKDGDDSSIIIFNHRFEQYFEYGLVE